MLPYNPLDKKNLGDSVANAMLDRPLEPLPPPDPFLGAGLYALYYRGGFDAYAPLANAAPDASASAPIYVGKAVPPGARKGGFGLGLNPGNVLFNRLSEHARSIDATENLLLADFACRFLVADDIWIPLGESLLIERFKPLWNVLVAGFGIHDPGRGRYGQQRSEWDTLHPGRSWAARLDPGPRDPSAIAERIAAFFSGQLQPTMSPEEIVEYED